MITILLTLLAALSLAAVAGWFSIIGIMSIYAGAAFHAVIMGIVLECGKLVTTSWVYRNWKFSSWKIKIPLIIFTLALMLITSIGVFGFLSKAHLDQGASTVDNAGKIERLDQQIAREQKIIADDEKVIAQLDATINSYLGKDRADRSVVIRRSQASQRKQLKEDIAAAQKQIDEFSDQKLKLQSEVRKLQLDVGPIRYIAEMVYGVGDTEKNIELAVRMFTLLIVSTFDPLAVVLLIAANQSIMRRENEKTKGKEAPTTTEQTNYAGRQDSDNKDYSEEDSKDTSIFTELRPSSTVRIKGHEESPSPDPLLKETMELLNEKENAHVSETVGQSGGSEDVRNGSGPEPASSLHTVDVQTLEITPAKEQAAEVPVNEEKESRMENIQTLTAEVHPIQYIKDGAGLPGRHVRPANKSSTSMSTKVRPFGEHEHVLHELVGSIPPSGPHFVPTKISEPLESPIVIKKAVNRDKYPKAHSWLEEFRRTQNERI